MYGYDIVVDTHASVCVAHKDHLLHELALAGVLGDHLPEDQEQLLDGVVLHGHHEADDCHQQGRRELLSIEDHLDHLLQGLLLVLGISLFCKIFNQTVKLATLS